MIDKVIRFFRISSLEQKLFVQAFFICVYIRLVVFALPMRWYAKRLGVKGQESSFQFNDDKQNEIKQVAKAIRRAVKYLPGKTKCLTRAIAAKILLSRMRIASTLYLGVAKEGGDKLIAHAWLRCGSEIITGKEEMGRFTVVAFFT